MNISVIRYILGWVIKIEAVLFILPCIVAICYGEMEGIAYLATMALCSVTGFIMTLKKPRSFVFYLKEGCVTTALSWISLGLFGCIPFMLTGEIPSFTDALFETISGFTTTGASILSDVESLSYCSLFWRSFTHWIGGMGVLVFLLAVIPLTGGSNINLMRAESPGPSVGKLGPKIRDTARLLYIIYISLTLLQIILLLFGGVTFFDALTTAFGTAGTGGFGIKNSSIAGYSPYVQWVVTVFMILFGVNFNAYYYVLYRKLRNALKMEEVRSYFIIIFVAIAIVFLCIYNNTMGVFSALRHSAFQVASIITTTGFSTVDFNLWPETAKMVLVALMFIGACAGSTGGGIKVMRFVVMFKTVIKELSAYMHPKGVKKLKVDGKPVEHEVLRSINVYMIVFIIIFTISLLLISVEGKSFTTNFTAVAATINNIGPGLDLVGPTGNFGDFSIFSKFVLIFDMLAGRLELLPMLILFYPPVWKETFTARVRSAHKKKQNKSK
ncbi:MAG: TrkH family potassium uptake protein [Lachnospiraceae bacterium]|nr:TrkH family potassium uptake protein [Lachnospiraceae bacterium]